MRPSPPTFHTRVRHARRRRDRALREIRQYQMSTTLLLRRAPFQRLVRELATSFVAPGDTLRWEPAALLALQEAAEARLVSLFADAMYSMIARGRRTLSIRDIQLTRRLQGAAHQD